MTWNWQQPDWPEFSFDPAALAEFEAQFLHGSGVLAGAYRHVGDDDKNTLTIDLISDEAMNTSEIEGEYLNRDSVQSSIRRNLGLQADRRRVPPAEQGIADLTVDLYKNFAGKLTDKMLFGWHRMLTQGRTDMADIGRWRRDGEPMQVVSGPLHKPKIHFEAPPSKNMAGEMKTFIQWFNDTAPQGRKPLPALARASIAHLYFASIHPFEDGNGRIGRAIAEKALAQNLGQPTLIALSQTINNNKKAYYSALEQNNKRNEITPWLEYFCATILAAQNHTQGMVDFIIAKAKLYDRIGGQLNARQDRLVARLFRAGPQGFEGGLSAENYIRITGGTSRATTTRDLQDLVEKGILTRTGERKATRYYLNAG